MKHLALPFALLLGACVPAPSETVLVPELQISEQSGQTLPAVKAFAQSAPTRPGRSNSDMARDFLDLTFQLESGRKVERFTRIEGPVRVRVTGTPPAGMMADLSRLMARLRAEADIDISLVQDNSAQITINAVSRARIHKLLPQAACFVLPNVSKLTEFRRASRQGKMDWASLQNRNKLAIFLPSDVSPQEARDCLHEELAQALGPLNDLYRLSDSVFNDDNVHTVLTGFDMLMLRAYYDPSLQNGMSQEQVAARLPAILARINPAGQTRPDNPLPTTPRSWIDAVQTALGPDASPEDRRRAAMKALSLAQTNGWQDHRRGFGHYIVARLNLGRDPEYAQRHFQQADRYFRNVEEGQLYQAYNASQLAALHIRRNQSKEALALINPSLKIAETRENAALLSSLMLLKAEALELSGRVNEAQAVRLDSLGWARYGFGPDWAVHGKLQEVASLNPLKGSNSGI